MLSFKNLSNSEAVLVKLLKFLGIHTDAKTINDEFEKHPDYPSLLSISDVLTTFKIENSAFRVTFDELENVPCPYLAHTNSNGGELLIVKEADSVRFVVSGEKKDRYELDVETFRNIFTGVVLLVEPPEEKPHFRESFARVLSEIKTTALATGFF